MNIEYIILLSTISCTGIINYYYYFKYIYCYKYEKTDDNIDLKYNNDSSINDKKKNINYNTYNSNCSIIDTTSNTTSNNSSCYSISSNTSSNNSNVNSNSSFEIYNEYEIL